MLINEDYILPAELTGYVREAQANQPPNQFAMAQWLPYRAIDDLSYRYNRGAGGLTDAAEYRAYDAESQVGKRPGVVRVEGQLPPISRKVRLGEFDRLRQRKDPTVGIRNGLLTDAENMTRQVSARVELARGDAVTNGSITINENGVIATVDFGRKGSHSVTAGVLWSNLTSAVPLTDMTSWLATYIASNGVPPGATVLTTPVLGYLLRNSEIRGLASVGGVTPSLVSQAVLRDIFTAHGLPPFYVIDTQVSVGGAATRIIPANVAIFLPAPTDPTNPDGTELGATLWGTTAESLDPSYGLAEGDEPGIVAGVYATADPIALWTKAAGIALPVMANPDLSFKAQVAA